MESQPSRILLIRPSALGDVCRTVPVLASLRAHFPRARIDWLVRDVYADAVAAHPALTGAVPFPRTELGRLWTPGGAIRALRWLRSLKAPGYDLVIDCQGLARSGLFALATRAHRRIGPRDGREGAPLAYTTRVATDPRQHVVDRALELVKSVGVEPVADMRLYSPQPTGLRREAGEGEGSASDVIEMQSPASGPLAGCLCAVLAPTSAWPGKRWPIERFAQLAQRLLDESLVERIVVVGAQREREQVGPMFTLLRGSVRRASGPSSDDRVVDLVGKTTVGQLMDVIESAALVVANDSAAMHMAVGFDRPLVALLGPTDAALAGPYHRLDAVVQVIEPGDRLSHRACKDALRGATMMRRIHVEDALEKARRQMGRNARVIQSSTRATPSASMRT